MDPGALNRRVHFMRALRVDDGYQSRPGQPAPYGGPVWASLRDVSDAERFVAGATRSSLTTRFVVRWSSLTDSLTPADTLRCEGRDYEIVGIKELVRRAYLEITCRRSDDE